MAASLFKVVVWSVFIAVLVSVANAAPRRRRHVSADVEDEPQQQQQPQQRRHHPVVRPCTYSVDGTVEINDADLDRLASNDESVSESDVDDGAERAKDAKKIHWSLELIGTTMKRLLRDVEQIESDYANARGAEDIALHADGMPLYYQLRIGESVLHAVNMTDTLADVADKLSRVTVLIGLLRLEELTHEPQPFSDELAAVENRLFEVLCRLRIAHVLSASAADGRRSAAEQTARLSNRIGSAVSALSLPEPIRAHHRHMRGFSILHDFGELLKHLVLRFDTMNRTM